MIKSFTNVCKIHWKQLLYQWIIALSCGVLFCVMALIIIDLGEETYAPIGSIMSICIFVLYSVLLGIQYFSTHFDRALERGETRTRYLVSIMVFFSVTTFLSLLAMNLVTFGEIALYEILYPGLECDADMQPFKLGLMLSAVIVVIVLMLAMVFGLVISKCGRNGFIAVYLLTCFSPLLISSIVKKFPGVADFIFAMFAFDVWYKPVVLMLPILFIIAVLFIILKKHSLKS